MSAKLRVVVACLVASACAPELPKSVASGFDPARDSFADKNFATGYDDSYLDTDLMRRMFGDVVCESGRTPCELTYAADAWKEQANATMGGGRCEGFAVLSTLLYTKDVDIASLGGDTPRMLSLDGNSALQRELAYWQATQLVAPVAAQKTKGYAAKDVMAPLAEALKPDAAERVRIGLVLKVGSRLVGGHALTPISYSRRADGVYVVRVYDSNTPQQERQLLVDVAANRWEYEASLSPSTKSRLFFGDAENQNPLYLSPVRVRRGVLPCPFCEDSTATVQTAGLDDMNVERDGASAVVKDGVVTVSGGATLTPIVSKCCRADDDAAFQAEVPGTGATRVTVSGAEGGNGEVSVVSQSVVANASGLSVPSGTQDTLSATSGGARYENQSHTPLTLSTATKTSTGNVVRAVATVSGASSAVDVSVSASGEIVLKADGTTDTDVSLVVTRTQPDGSVSTGQVVVRVTADGGTASIVVPTASWNGDAGLPATLTENGTMRPAANVCADGLRNGNEADVDCGGRCAAKCAVQQRCATGIDCASSVCATAGRCVATECEDGRLDGDETDVDCGGSCGKCATTKMCSAPTDCVSDFCQGNVCRVGSVVSVNVTGLRAGELVTLFNNGADELSVAQAGTFPFSRRVLGPYAVTVHTQPSTAACAVMNGTGMATGAPVTVSVVCTAGFTVGGTAAGLAMGEVAVVSLNNVAFPVSMNGAFTFPNRVASSYAVVVESSPPTATCTVTNGAGTATADVNTVQVNCVRSFALRGSLSGLPVGASVSLVESGGPALVLSANGAFAFPTRITGPYNVAIAAQPMTALCAVTNGVGTATADVTNVQVSCATDFALQGTAVGIPNGQTLTLHSSIGIGMAAVERSHPLTMNGAFSLPRIPFSGGYEVRVETNPVGARCAIANAIRVNVGTPRVGGDVVDVIATCVPTGFPVSGIVTGLPAGNTVGISLNAGPTLTLNTKGGFTFSEGATTTYAVQVVTQPANAVCTVLNGSGTAGLGVPFDLQVRCVPTTGFTIAGSVSGLPAGERVSLSNNAGTPLVLLTNGRFTFPTTTTGAYALTVSAQPQTAQCTVTLPNLPDTASYPNPGTADEDLEVRVACVPAFQIGGTVTGLPSGQSVTLESTDRSMGGSGISPFTTMTVTVSANGTYVFGARTVGFDVAVLTQPTGATCTVANGSGAATSNRTNVNVTCVP